MTVCRNKEYDNNTKEEYDNNTKGGQINGVVLFQIILWNGKYEKWGINGEMVKYWAINSFW